LRQLTAQLHAALADQRVVALREAADEGVCVGEARRLAHVGERRGRA
jgi:hypothetical protein